MSRPINFKDLQATREGGRDSLRQRNLLRFQMADMMSDANLFFRRPKKDIKVSIVADTFFKNCRFQRNVAIQ